MIKELLHPIAVDLKGKAVHISQAEKGGEYFCPFCKNTFVFNRSLKKGKGSRRAHFSHERLSPNCTPEGYLHSTFKIMLLEKLSSHIETALPFMISFKCNWCQNTHTSDILSGAIAVQGEYDLKVCRPDIALLTTGGRVYAVIEIVVTHDLDENAKKFYKDNQIVVIRIKVNSDDDLQKIEEKSMFPSEVLLNNQQQCPIFLELQRQHQVLLKMRRFQIQPSALGRTGSRIDQIEAQRTANDRKQYFAIKNYYKKKKR